MSVLHTNISAIRASNASNSASKMLGTAMERLSTGKRINSAKDDAAGLAIATSMTSQIKGMSQGIRNANDGISLAQTAEGTLSEVGNMLQRVRELAIQSASGTYQTSDRAAMQQEVTALTTQINDSFTQTKFNGNTLISTTAGTDMTFDIQTGSGSGQRVTLTSKASDGTNMTATALDVTDTIKATATLTNVDKALKDVNAARASLWVMLRPPRPAISSLRATDGMRS